MVPRRLRRLPRLGCGQVTVYVADSFAARLVGLAGLASMPSRSALLLTRCSSIHTFGMRFAVHVLFLDEDFEVVGDRRAVRPGQIVRHRGARAVVEFQAEEPTRPASR